MNSIKRDEPPPKMRKIYPKSSESDTFIFFEYLEQKTPDLGQFILFGKKTSIWGRFVQFGAKHTRLGLDLYNKEKNLFPPYA